MDCQMPWPLQSAAECVSSERWADASYPVIVYCVKQEPKGRIEKKNRSCCAAFERRRSC